jgi:GT2 family glycosyltransferase
MALPGPRLKKRRRKHSEGAPDATNVAAVSGAFMLIPRSDFENLGAFDVGFATDGADLDLCRRTVEAGGSVLFHATASGVQFSRARQGRREAQGLALFASKSAKTPVQRVFAIIARPIFEVMLALRDFVAGKPPLRR